MDKEPFKTSVIYKSVSKWKYKFQYSKKVTCIYRVVDQLFGLIVYSPDSYIRKCNVSIDKQYKQIARSLKFRI